MIDIHSHILPGIDDGSRDIAESVDMARDLVMQGVTDVIATPHYMNDTPFMSPRSDNLKLLAELKSALADEGLKLNVHLGNEIYIGENMRELLENGTISTLAGSNYVLVELPLDDQIPNYVDYLQDLMNCGYQVILAHPERYSMVQTDYNIAKDLHAMGILLQCNVGSLIDKYGKEAKKTIKRLIRDKIVFAFGSDIHRSNRPHYITLAQKKLSKYCNSRELTQLMALNPQKILASSRD